MMDTHGICGHTYCLLLADGLFEHGTETGLARWDFPIENIQSVIEEAAQKRCFVCSESGASITCRESGCDRSFHLPCAMEGECITQFFPPFRYLCSLAPLLPCSQEEEPSTAHLPSLSSFPQVLLPGAPPRAGSGGGPRGQHQLPHLHGARGRQTLLQHHGVPSMQKCLVPQELHPGRSHSLTWAAQQSLSSSRASLRLLLLLLQENAIHAGIMSFMCPACRERDVFVVEMLVMGILVPLSLPSWITDDPPELEERHSRCDARECLCPGGREQVEEEGPWQLLLCCSCAAEGTHRACSSLGDSTTSWQCAGCAGPSIASSVTSELTGSSCPSQEAAGASRSSPGQEEGGASSISPSQEAAGASCSSPVLESGRRSTPPGPMRVRDRSRSRRRAQNPYTRPRQRRDRRHSGAPQTDNSESSSPSQTAAGASRSSPSQEAAGASRSSPVLESGRRSTPPGPMRVRDRSRSRRRAQNPYTRPRQSRDRRHSGALQADSSESSSPSQVASEASSPSRVLQSGRRSTRSGSVRVQDRSRSGRRAQTPDSQPRQRRGRSRRAAPRAESSSPSQMAAGASRSSTAGNSGHRSRTGPVRVRDRSRLQRRARRPYSRHR
ncbi:splicing factor, arginine/serine-rich 19-like [Heliangelus exortis]|uniref:splicing factor, arginine/serine-rich 19-like n=2 Tax=Heliangelus exortis TaxID=472823 RepID=UPI003A91208A